jgi:acetyl esterase/lipase
MPETLSYGPMERHKVDIYPARGQKRGGDTPSPVLVFLYGGGWDSGDRSLYPFLGRAFAAKGFTVAIPDYRIYPHARYPDFMEDAALAFRWVVQNIEAYGGDAERLHLMGHSAGAHMGALLSLDPDHLTAVDCHPDRIRSFTGVAGPYSFNPLDYDSTRPIFESAPDIDKARPIKHAHSDAPPMLLLHPTNDKTVYVENSENLANAVTAVGGTARHIPYPRVGHVGVIVSIAWPVRFLAPTFRDSLAFMREHDPAVA